MVQSKRSIYRCHVKSKGQSSVLEVAFEKEGGHWNVDKILLYPFLVLLFFFSFFFSAVCTSQHASTCSSPSSVAEHGWCWPELSQQAWRRILEKSWKAVQCCTDPEWDGGGKTTSSPSLSSRRCQAAPKWTGTSVSWIWAVMSSSKFISRLPGPIRRKLLSLSLPVLLLFPLSWFVLLHSSRFHPSDSSVWFLVQLTKGFLFSLPLPSCPPPQNLRIRCCLPSSLSFSLFLL